LNPCKAGCQTADKQLHSARFAKARRTLNENMPPCEQANQKPLDKSVNDFDI